MSHSTDEHDAVTLVRAFLDASMKPDPLTASTYLADDVVITFTGGRRMADAAAVTAFNASRYAWVKKALGPFDWSEHRDHVVVYSNGTLYGEWKDGRAFAGNRFLDRFEVRDGRITRMDVWNDSAERMLDPAIDRSDAPEDGIGAGRDRAP